MGAQRNGELYSRGLTVVEPNKKRGGRRTLIRRERKRKGRVVEKALNEGKYYTSRSDMEKKDEAKHSIARSVDRGREERAKPPSASGGE